MQDSNLGILHDPDLHSQRTRTSCGSEIFSYFRDLPDDVHHKHSSTRPPILVLLHGYPQTSFIWRHLIPLLPREHPLFIPDLPGYGRSSPSTAAHDKRTIGLACLEALHAILTQRGLLKDTDASPPSIVLIGHDRGARIAHRLAVDFQHLPAPASPSAPAPPPPTAQAQLHHFHPAALCVLDILPDHEQWSSFADPAACTSSFHWPFLANAELAARMIGAYGGARWCRDLMARWCGGGGGSLDGDTEGLRALKSDRALEAYASALQDPAVVRATCEDYAAGAGPDAAVQRADVEAGRKVAGRVLVVFSEGYLGRGRDVGGVWRRWVDVDKGAELACRGIGGGVGHFVAEEAAGEVAGWLGEWLGGLKR